MGLAAAGTAERIRGTTSVHKSTPALAVIISVLSGGGNKNACPGGAGVLGVYGGGEGPGSRRRRNRQRAKWPLSILYSTGRGTIAGEGGEREQEEQRPTVEHAGDSPGRECHRPGYCGRVLEPRLPSPGAADRRQTETDWLLYGYFLSIVLDKSAKEAKSTKAQTTENEKFKSPS